MISNLLSLLDYHVTRAGCGVVVAVFLISIYLYNFRPQLRTLDVPSFDGVATDLGTDFSKAICEGTKRHPDSIFKLNTANHETVILPSRYIDEIKSTPPHKLSITGELYERLLGKFTLIGTAAQVPGFVHSIRSDLNRNLDSAIPTLLEEATYAVKSSLGPYADWTAVRVYPTTLRMVALLTGRVFVGLPLSRNEKWVESSVQITVDTFETAFALWNYHWTIRPLAALCSPKFWNIRRRNSTIAELLKDPLKQRLRLLEQEDVKKPVDVLQFFLQNVVHKDLASQAKLHSAINVAAIHTTTMNVTHILYDLASHPEYLEPLRQEAQEVFAATDGVLDKSSLWKLRKMDSFMRESQRLSPPGIVSMSRKVVSEMRLNDGTILPAGALVACDSWWPSRDPENWPDPDTFDGLRFERLRFSPGNDAKYQFVTTSPTNMPFGHGPHACPGRFFVANEIKILLAYLVIHYDIRQKPGCERPRNRHLNVMLLPDTEAEIEFKSRASHG